jgi:hypothetical protein
MHDSKARTVDVGDADSSVPEPRSGEPRRVSLRKKATRLGSEKEGTPMAFRKAHRLSDGEDEGRDTSKLILSKVSYLSSAASTQSTAPLSSELGLEEAISSMDETRNVVATMSKIQSNYHEAQQRMNSIDVTQLEVFVTAQTLHVCFNTVKGYLMEHDPDFEGEAMQSRLEQFLKKVAACNSEFSQYKGEFLAISEPFVNKDILQVKLKKVQAHLERQEQFLGNKLWRLEQHEDQTKENATALLDIKKKYWDFEAALFRKEIEGSANVIRETEAVLAAIGAQQAKLLELTEQAG